MDPDKLLLGSAKGDITPDRPIPLAGYFSRTKVSIGVAHPLAIRALVFEDSVGARALLISADLIWWERDVIDVWKKKIERRFAIPESAQLFVASHTHSAPMPGPHFASTLGKSRRWYRQKLQKTVYAIIKEAFENRELISHVSRGVAPCDIGIHRRKRVGNEVIMAPNPGGAVDREVTVFRFHRHDGSVKSLLTHFTCHPTVKGDRYVSSEYCGDAMDKLEGETGVVSLFLQGCAGDTRPNLQEDGRFVVGNVEQIAQFGEVLLKAIRQAACNAQQHAFAGKIHASTEEVELPFQAIPTKEDLILRRDVLRTPSIAEPTPLQRAIELKWIDAMLSPGGLRPYERFHLSFLSIGSQLKLMGFSGETVLEYGLHVKSLGQGEILPIGYANGMSGYIPTDQQIAEGGYEGGGAHKLFLLPAPFRTGIETQIKDAVEKMIPLRRGSSCRV